MARARSRSRSTQAWAQTQFQECAGGQEVMSATHSPVHQRLTDSCLSLGWLSCFTNPQNTTLTTV